MKNIFVFVISLLAVNTFAQPTATSAKDSIELLNKLSAYESKIRKYEGELKLKSDQVKTSTKTITQLNSSHAKLLSEYRKVLSDSQFLKYQNDMLLKALKSSDGYTPELANKFKEFNKGRLPASIPEPEKAPTKK